MSMAAGVPVVDFSSLSLNVNDDELDESRMKMAVSEMMDAFSTTGFVYLSNTHFSDQLVQSYAFFVTEPLYNIASNQPTIGKAVTEAVNEAVVGGAVDVV